MLPQCRDKEDWLGEGYYQELAELVRLISRDEKEQDPSNSPLLKDSDWRDDYPTTASFYKRNSSTLTDVPLAEPPTPEENAQNSHTPNDQNPFHILKELIEEVIKLPVRATLENSDEGYTKLESIHHKTQALANALKRDGFLQKTIDKTYHFLARVTAAITYFAAIFIGACFGTVAGNFVFPGVGGLPGAVTGGVAASKVADRTISFFSINQNSFFTRGAYRAQLADKLNARMEKIMNNRV